MVMSRKQTTISRMMIAPGICLLMLGGLLAEGTTRIHPADAEPFHRRAFEAINGVPAVMQEGQWVSEEEPEPPSATALLRPNAVLSRRYLKRLPDGQTLSCVILIVQCKDARDMQGHYPPNCYPANGAQLVESEARTWNIGGKAVEGMEYLFTELGEGRNLEKRVYNFFVIPEIPGLSGGVHGICPGIASIYKSGEDYQRRYYGAAQFQFVFSNDLPRSVRDQIMDELLAPNWNVVDVLKNDGGNAPPHLGNPQGRGG